MKRMLINATQEEEKRVALVDGQRLYDLDIENPSHEQKIDNVYKGKISRVEPSIEAAFVDYGVERHGFLPLKEIAKEYFTDGVSGSQHADLKAALPEGTEVIVQLKKEERGLKGAALTTFISLSGSHIVLMPNNPKAGGVSKQVTGEDHDRLEKIKRELPVPKGMGVILRTASAEAPKEYIEWDLKMLLNLWDSIKEAAAAQGKPFLIYKGNNIVDRAIKDYLRPDINEIIVDSKDVYDRTIKHLSMVRPEFTERVKLYEGEVPLFTHFQIESQIETAYQREVKLPSGGAIVIDPTEALTSIDVNSGRATKGADIEETALQTNLEAADEIARQLRLRDMGGLFVIDFIDMTPKKNQHAVEERMRANVSDDRARIQIAPISRFGLLELSRQRLKPSISDSSMHVCPRCNGQGFIRDNESLALSVLRLIEQEALKDGTGEVHAKVPVVVAAYLLNEKRENILAIERREKVRIFVIPIPSMETPHFEVIRVRSGDSESSPDVMAAVEANAEDESSVWNPDEPTDKRPDDQRAAVSAEKIIVSSGPLPAEPAPSVQKPEPRPAPEPVPPEDISDGAPEQPISGTGFFSRVKNFFLGAFSGDSSKKSSGSEEKPSSDDTREKRDQRDDEERITSESYGSSKRFSGGRRNAPQRRPDSRRKQDQRHQNGGASGQKNRYQQDRHQKPSAETQPKNGRNAQKQERQSENRPQQAPVEIPEYKSPKFTPAGVKYVLTSSSAAAAPVSDSRAVDEVYREFQEMTSRGASSGDRWRSPYAGSVSEAPAVPEPAAEPETPQEQSDVVRAFVSTDARKPGLANSAEFSTVGAAVPDPEGSD